MHLILRKKLVILLFSCCIFYLPTKAETIDNAILWNDDASWSEIVSKAKSLNRCIFIDCYTTWCAPCKRMDKEVFSDPSVYSYLNENFICVKIQMDRTKNDKIDIIRRYSLADSLKHHFSIAGFPTTLIISPSGLVGKSLGFQNVKNILKLANSSISNYENNLPGKLVAYLEGRSMPGNLDDLAFFAKEVMGSDSLALKIALQYIDNASFEERSKPKSIRILREIIKNQKLADIYAKVYIEAILGTMSYDQLLDENILSFVRSNGHLFQPDSKIFKLCYMESKRVDSIIGITSFSKSLLEASIARYDLYNTFSLNADSTIIDSPQWDCALDVLSRRYPKLDNARILLNFQIGYYRSINRDWKKWAEFNDKKIGMELLTDKQLANASIELNYFGAWDVFMYSMDTSALVTALRWIDMHINARRSTDKTLLNFWFLDTKANLLYKLKRTREAIIIQEEALKEAKRAYLKDPSDLIKHDLINIERALIAMKAGKPTYLEEGAVWEK